MSSLSSMNRQARSLISKIFHSNQRLASSSSPLLQRRRHGLTTISHSSGSAKTGEVIISPRMNDVWMIKMYGSARTASKVYKVNNLRTRMVNPSHLSLTRVIHESTQKDVDNESREKLSERMEIASIAWMMKMRRRAPHLVAYIALSFVPTTCIYGYGIITESPIPGWF